ncbi:MAG: alcohol dehydrogenase catalytic domain-containing protein [Lachnospiraceae bacterium]|nr:alcohol dehydrogenase catalytic domain-containing protein [Lachnospiraceae bacterium]
MLNTVYRLVAPGRFEVEFSDIDLTEEVTLVRPTYLSICHADQRYYQGLRAFDILKEKLPMALIHEGIGEVVWDGSGTFAPGEPVVMIPNTPEEEDAIVAENYLRSSRFRASGVDGFMQDLVDIRPDRLVRLPEGIHPVTASFTELVTVSVHALRRFDQTAHSRRRAVGIWGDGNLGYITAVFFKAMFPEVKLYIFGLDHSKLLDFTFADETYLVTALPSDLVLDHAIECVGGEGAPKAINQIIDWIQPEGTIAILGVSENPVAVNTRMMLEKGLRMFGSSRSGREDFIRTIQLYQEKPEILEYLQNIIGAVVEINTIEDMKKAFELDRQNAYGKTVMEWKK